MSRRAFLAVATGGAGAVLAACSEPMAPTPERIVITVASFPGLATVGQVVKVGSAHAARRTGPTAFEAYSMYCTHQGCLTALSGQQFNCPCHGSQFDNSGAVIRGPAGKPLAKLPTAYNAATDTLTIN